MASFIKAIYRNKLIPPCCNRLSAALSTSSSKSSDIKSLPILMDRATALLNAKERAHLKKLKEGHIKSDTPMDISLISGVPEEHIKGRYVRIFQYPKNAMQSGTFNVGKWTMAFDTRERWENPLMGWSSSGDPLSNLQIEFNTANDAIDFCDKNGWKWFVEQEPPPTVVSESTKPKSYASNFSWNKRSRVTTK